MNIHSIMLKATTSYLPKVATNNWMDQISQSLGISGDPQGFFLYLLIMVGIFVVISILIYNWLEERRFNKQVESNFSTIEEDALLDEKQQQFFDKFASTTGVLNDQPPEGTFIDEDGEALEDDRSIEDVYAELLESMSKRNRKEKIEPDALIIDEVEVITEPVLNIPRQAADISQDKESLLFIPESTEVNDAVIVESEIIEPSVASEGAVNLTFGETDTVAMPVDVTEAVSASAFAETEQIQEVDIASVEEVATPEENDIKAIINRAFKEKYNPNFKPEPEVQAEAEEVAEQEEGVDSPGDEVAEVEEAPIEPEPMEQSKPDEIEASEETIPSLIEPVAEEPPIITESVEINEVPVLNFPAEEVPNEPLAPLEPEAQMEAPEEDERALDFLKGLDGSEEPEPDFSEALMQADAEPPILDEKFSVEETTPSGEIADSPTELEEPLMQTYQQLLNTDKLQEPSADETGAASFTAPKTNQEEQAAPDASTASKQTAAKEGVETQPDTNPDTSESAPVEKQSVFTDALPAHLNPHIDFIGTIEASKGSNAAFVLESFSAFHKQFEFPVFVFMQSQQSQWLLLNDVTEAEISRYLERNQPVHITASIQMADRTGPISRNTIQRFKQSLSEIAVTMGATAEWVDPTDPIDRAASLDAFCIEVDKTMFFHLANTKTPFTGIKLKGLVETQGMVLERDGSYKYYDLNTDSGIKRSVPDFVLFNRDNHKFTEEMLRTSVIKAVTMQLDIPLILTSASALDRMVVIAQSLESSLSAQLVDDKNRQITDVHLARIREQIKSIHAAMQLRGITPGSSHAQRLFS